MMSWGKESHILLMTKEHTALQNFIAGDFLLNQECIALLPSDSANDGWPDLNF